MAVLNACDSARVHLVLASPLTWSLAISQVSIEHYTQDWGVLNNFLNVLGGGLLISDGELNARCSVEAQTLNSNSPGMVLCWSAVESASAT